MLPNPDAKNFYKNQYLFHDALVEQCEKEGVAVVNMTGMHASLLEKKRYADMTGNNVNHPNDYLARVYAQTLLQTIRTEQPVSSEQSGEKSGCGGVVSGAVGAPITLALAGTVIRKRKRETDK